MTVAGEGPRSDPGFRRQAVAGLISLLRPGSVDSPSEAGRASERDRRIASTALANAAARVVAIFVSFVSVPLAARYLGAERYGMWLTISSVVAILGPLDLGIGNGLLQRVSAAMGRDDRDEARASVSTALAFLGALGLIVAGVGLVLGSIAPWAAVFNVSSNEAAAEAGPLATVVIVLFAAGLPLSVAGTVQSALQSGYVAALWSGVGSLASLGALVVAIAAGAQLPVLAAALMGAGLLAALANLVVLTRRQRPWLSPRLRDVSRSTGSALLRTGGVFLVLQLAGLIGYQVDNIVIAQLRGSAEVQQYAIPFRMFAVAPALVGVALMPLWPAYREALARGDRAWVLHTLKRSAIFAAAVDVPVAIVLAVAGPAILAAWVGAAVTPTPLLLAGLALWCAMNSINAPLAMLLNGADAIRFQAACATAMAIANVILSVLLVQHIGVAGAVVGTIVSQAVCILLPCALYVPRLIARIRGGEA